MERYIGFIERSGVWILALALGLTVAAGFRLGDLGYSDDVTAFLPEGDPEVARFWKVGELFGGLNIAIIGLEVLPEDEDVFTASRLAALLDLTKALKHIEGVAAVSGLGTVQDVVEQRRADGEMETVVSDLLPAVPASEAGLKALREHILSSAHLVGGFISADGRAVLTLCHLDDHVSPLETAARIRTEMERRDFAAIGLMPHYGGAPFISEGLARAAEEDLVILGPIVAAIILLIIVLSFRSGYATLLSLLPVGMAIVMTLGLMAHMDAPLTLISSALPVILLALGSAYPIHVVARALAVARERGRHDREAVREAMRRVGPPVFVAALTTVLGFLSFQVMNIQPMRDFGLFMAAGVAVSALIALVVVPAALMHLKMGVMRPEGGLAHACVRFLQTAVAALDKRARVILALFAVIGGFAAWGATFIETEMSTRSYFTRETDVTRADTFLQEKFGGSLFLQLIVEGDIHDPIVLEEIARLEDFASAVPGVSNVSSVTQVVRIASKSLLGKDALPRTRGVVEALATLAEGDPAIRLMVTEDWKAALVQIRLGGFDTKKATRILETIRGYTNNVMARSGVAIRWRGAATAAPIKAATLDRAARDLEWVLYDDIEGNAERRTAIVQALDTGLAAAGSLDGKAFRAGLTARLERDLIEDELVYIEGEEAGLPKVVDAFLAAMKAGPLAPETTRRILLDHAQAEEREAAAEEEKSGKTDGGFARAVKKVHGGVRELQDGASRDAMLVALRAATADAKDGWANGLRSSRAERIAEALTSDTVFATEAFAKESGAETVWTNELEAAVSGYPVLWAGMNDSIHSNQSKSVAISFVGILILLCIIFRSFVTGFAAMVPTGLTLLLSFGALGFVGTPIDMGSTMISSIAFGVGIDYAIHFIWWYRRRVKDGPRQAGEEALAVTGTAIVVNALEVGLSFGVLAFGTVAPMSRFGLLTGETMLIAALVSLLLLPLMLWRHKVVPAAIPAPAPVSLATGDQPAGEATGKAREATENAG